MALQAQQARLTLHAWHIVCVVPQQVEFGLVSENVNNLCYHKPYMYVSDKYILSEKQLFFTK